MSTNNIHIPAFRVGYDTYDQPEVMPDDAFPQLEDALCFRGILKKRDGYYNLLQPIDIGVTAIANAVGALVTTAANHYYNVGDSVVFTNCVGVYAGFNGIVFNIVTTPALNQFTIDNTIAPGVYIPASGTVHRYPYVGTMGIAAVAPGAVTTITTIAAAHNLTPNQTVFIGNVEGTIGDPIYNSDTYWPVTAITNAFNAIVTTSTQNGYQLGDQVIFENCQNAGGLINGFNFDTFNVIAIISPTQFQINNAILPGVYVGNSGTVRRVIPSNFGYPATVTGANTFTIPVNTAGFAYVRGGTIHQPIMGLNNQISAGLFENLIINDQTQAYLFVPGFNDVINISGAIVWTGNDSQFFWSTNYFGSYWTTNNFDPIRYYFGAAWTNYTPVIDGIGTQLTRALMIVPYKNRLVALNTGEGAAPNVFPQRARWSALGTPYVGIPTPPPAGTNANAWRSDIVGQGGYIDAPTQEKIVSAEFVKDTLVVYFERSTWRLRYTGNNLLPFIWERINSQLGAECTYSRVGFDDGAIAIGRQGIVLSDMNSAVRIDDKIIPDQFTLIEFGEQNGQRRVHGIRDMERMLVYWCYPTDDQPFPNKVLCYNYLDKNFAVFNNQFTTFGYFRTDDDITWGADDNQWQDEDRFWNAGNLQQGFPIVVAGNRLGEVWQIQAVNADNDVPFNWVVLTKKFNPYIAQGLQAKAIYMHILCEGDSGGQFTIEHFINENISVPIETLTVSSDSFNQDKVWRRVQLSGTGQYHQFRILFSGAQLIDQDISFDDYAIYQIVLEFEPAGRLNYGDFTT